MVWIRNWKDHHICFIRFLWLRKVLLCCFLFIFLLASVPGIGYISPLSTASAEDSTSIDSLIRALYQSITFSEDGAPNLERFRSLFHPEAHFIRINPEGVDEMNLTTFISSFSQRIGSGQLKSFHESEISRRTDSYAGIAQVFSTYQKGMNTQNPEEFSRGINCIQLYHDGQRWWIISIIWQDEQPDNPIPEEYIKQRTPFSP